MKPGMEAFVRTYPSTEYRGIDFATQIKTDNLSRLAVEDATSRLSNLLNDKDRYNATRRVWNAIFNRFAPYVLENEIIAEQISSADYIDFIKRQRQFLRVRVGGNACSDERIAAAAVFDPRVSHLHRRVQGLLEAKPSEINPSSFVLDDTIIDDSVKNALRLQPDAKHFVEFIGPHIDSGDPANGCGAAKAKVGEKGMKLGAIAEYFEEMGDKFHAFENTIAEAEGQATLFDMTHDAYSQGLIFGLKDNYRNFSPKKSLRDNLMDLHNKKKIIMTELLDPEIREKMNNSQSFRNSGMTNMDTLRLNDPTQFAKNMILIGNIAREITEAGDFSFVPDPLKQDKHPDAVRALAYHAIRNSVYRILGGINPDHNALRDHVTTNIRVGPTGAAFNQKHGSLIQVAPHGELRPVDIAGIKALNGVSKHVGEKLHIDADLEGRVIIVTGEYTEIANHANDLEKREEVIRQTRENAEVLRNEFREDVLLGRIIVIPAIHRGSSREIIDELSPLLINGGTSNIRRVVS